MNRYTFAEFVEYGKNNGGNIVNGMPWSFKIHGVAVTHENDQCYLICLSEPPHTLHFTPADVLTFDEQGKPHVSPTPVDAPMQEPASLEIFEWLSYYGFQRDDLTLEDAAQVIRHGWTTVHGRTERQLVLQIAWLLATAPPAPPERDDVLERQNADLLPALHSITEALKFYADGSHFHKHDPSAWDTVSGEPQNFYEDESNTATVEDGSIAKLALDQLRAALKSHSQPPVQGVTDK